jgi:hypothetical protein
MNALGNYNGIAVCSAYTFRYVGENVLSVLTSVVSWVVFCWT